MTSPLNVEQPVPATPSADDPSRPFVHRWIQLVSVTNWEKGRIIFDWRSALEASNAPVSQYSDEAWAERVGNVTGQHVGRLRRTYERFGEVHAEYPGLFWSHFQVALDWDDAEMWLEGAVQNDWSVSQMRAKRVETLGGPSAATASDEPSDADILDEDASPFADEASQITGDIREVADATHETQSESSVANSFDSDDDASADESVSAQSAAAKSPRARPFENLPKLPDDVAEAFEQFKLAILTHKMMDWAEISRDDMLACLAALEALALQPAGE